jgi:hypothetical protein
MGRLLQHGIGCFIWESTKKVDCGQSNGRQATICDRQATQSRFLIGGKGDIVSPCFLAGRFSPIIALVFPRAHLLCFGLHDVQSA